MHRQAAGLVDMPRRPRTFKPIERPDFNVEHVNDMPDRHRRMRVSNVDGYPIHPGRQFARGTKRERCKPHAGPEESVDSATRLRVEPGGDSTTQFGLVSVPERI